MISSITNFIIAVAESTWEMLVDSALFLLVGILLAGLLHLLLNETNLKKLLSGTGNKMIFKAALFGIPLPLCSCSVLPMAHQLRREGLSKGGTTAFLISTPETGVDSILLTYSLTDPLMTAARPIAAFLTASLAGMMTEKLDRDHAADIELTVAESAACGCCCETSQPKTEPVTSKINSAVKYSIKTVLGDLAPYLLIGYLLAGLVSVLIGGVETIPEFLRTGWGGYLGAVLVGLPLYVCATSSTPLAAALLASGFSPGAVLVFLLVGPATNIATVTVVSKILSYKSAVIYVVVIIAVSILCGLGVDYTYHALNFQPAYITGEHNQTFLIIKVIIAIAMALAIGYYSLKALIKKLK